MTAPQDRQPATEAGRLFVAEFTEHNGWRSGDRVLAFYASRGWRATGNEEVSRHRHVSPSIDKWLHIVIREEAIERWLDTPAPAFQDGDGRSRTAREVIAAGRSDIVERTLMALAEGVFT